MTQEMTIPVVHGDAYQKATVGGETGLECRVCGKQTGKTGNSLHIRLVQADDDLVPAPIDADIPEEDDLGFFPVGPECARKFPQGFVQSMRR